MKRLENAFNNRSRIKSASVFDEEINDTDHGEESVVFCFEDKKGNEFSIGIQTILQCFGFAIEENQLPKISEMWRQAVNSRYNRVFDDFENISYNDYLEPAPYIEDKKDANNSIIDFSYRADIDKEYET